MAVLQRSIGVPTTDTTGTSITLAAPPTVVSTDYLVAFIHNSAASATSDLTADGWSRIGAPFVPSTTDIRITGMYVRIAGSSEPSSYTFTFPGTGSRSMGFIASYGGVDISNPIAVSTDWSRRTATSNTLSVTGLPAAASLYSLQIWSGNFASPQSYAPGSYTGGLTQLPFVYNPSGPENTSVTRSALMTWSGIPSNGGIPDHTITTTGNSVGAASYIVALNPSPVAATTAWLTA